MTKRFEVMRFPGATPGQVVFDHLRQRRVTAKQAAADAQEIADLLNAMHDAGVDKSPEAY